MFAMSGMFLAGNSVFSGMFCRMQTSMQVGYGGRTEQVAGELVSGTFFPLLGLQPAAGRLFSAGDERSIARHRPSARSTGALSANIRSPV